MKEKTWEEERLRTSEEEELRADLDDVILSMKAAKKAFDKGNDRTTLVLLSGATYLLGRAIKDLAEWSNE